MPIKINATKLLVEDIIEVTDKTAGGIYIPNAVIKTEAMKAKVAVVGGGTPDIKIAYNVGDTVLFHSRAGNKFKYENKEYRLLDVNEVFLGGI